MKTNYFFFPFLFINVFAYGQNNIRLEAYEFSRDRKAQHFISEIDFKILSNHKALVDSTWWGSQYSFETSEKEINIQYKNIYGQALDTIVEIHSNNQIVGIWIDKFQDYQLDTFLEKSIEENVRWKLNEKVYAEFTFYNTEVEVFKSDGNYYLAYNFERRWLKKPTNKHNFKVNLKEEDLAIINRFEKLIRTKNLGDLSRLPSYLYTLTAGDKVLKFENDNTIEININYLMVQLGIDL